MLIKFKPLLEVCSMIITVVTATVKACTSLLEFLSWIDFTLLVVIVILLFIIWSLAGKRKYMPSLKWSYINKNSSSKFYFVDRQNILYNREITVKALKNGANNFVVHYSWTGSCVDSIEIKIIRRSKYVSNLGYDLVCEQKKNGEEFPLKDRMIIKLHTPLENGEELYYRVGYKLIDEKEDMKPTMSVRMLRPYEQAEMEIDVPENTIKNVRVATSLSYSDESYAAEIPLMPTLRRTSECREVYKYEIPQKSLKLLYVHSVDWDFIN